MCSVFLTLTCSAFFTLNLMCSLFLTLSLMCSVNFDMFSILHFDLCSILPSEYHVFSIVIMEVFSIEVFSIVHLEVFREQYRQRVCTPLWSFVFKLIPNNYEVAFFLPTRAEHWNENKESQNLVSDVVYPVPHCTVKSPGPSPNSPPHPSLGPFSTLQQSVSTESKETKVWNQNHSGLARHVYPKLHSWGNTQLASWCDPAQHLRRGASGSNRAANEIQISKLCLAHAACRLDFR